MSKTSKVLQFVLILCFSANLISQTSEQGYSTQIELGPNSNTPSIQVPSYTAETLEANRSVFGGNLFTGSFAQQSFAGFNPDYQINVGDKLYIQVWGAVEFDGEQLVDAQGNIFLPQVGPIRVLGSANSKLNDVIKGAVSRIYTNNVYIYASLISAQPVKIFVTGNVVKPGLYPGLSSDSILSYLDRAGGIDPYRGSYLDISLKRNSKTIATFNLYEFLIEGDIKSLQLHEGDVLVVGSRQYTLEFDGVVENPYQLEFAQPEVSLKNALALVKPLPQATHISIERNTGLTREVEYLELKAAIDANIKLFAGDRISIVADKSQATIGIVIEGEHLGQAQYILPYGAKLGDLLPLLSPSGLSDLGAIQLFRRSLAKQQKRALEDSLKSLEAQVLSARNDTVEEAQLRTQEAQLVLQFIDRARAVKPKGQVVLGNTDSALDVTLENGDRIVIPALSNLVAINGEVLFPSATVYRDHLSALDYIKMSGGFTQRADDARIILRKPSGLISELSKKQLKKAAGHYVTSGDEILVLPAVDTKNLQYTKDIIQIIYQLALSAGVVLSINN